MAMKKTDNNANNHGVLWSINPIILPILITFNLIPLTLNTRIPAQKCVIPRLNHGFWAPGPATGGMFRTNCGEPRFFS